DVLICRTRIPISVEMKNKISLFCDVGPEAVIDAPDTDTIYEVPLNFEKAGLAELVVKRLGLPERDPDLEEWRTIVERIRQPRLEVEIAVIGKYIQNGDAYISIAEALKHGGIANDAHVNIRWLDSEELEALPAEKLLDGVDAVVVAGGFGGRGVEGKISAVRYARETNTPYLGLCYGMQMAVIEYARNVLGLKDAHTEEVCPDTPHPLIHILPEQKSVKNKGATMRLGAFRCQLVAGSLAEKLYGAPVVSERHRHRYELNNEYREKLAKHGMLCSGLSPDYRLAEIVEIPGHPFFIATQFHPEFQSRPNRAHPLFSGLVAAAVKSGARDYVAAPATPEGRNGGERGADESGPAAQEPHERGRSRRNGRGNLQLEDTGALEL
ncbi:MAG TPA: CTP synthase, partial [Chthonomonadales bacterium]|nr:CTP synthase [Chthonomonadales bacterium]